MTIFDLLVPDGDDTQSVDPADIADRLNRARARIGELELYHNLLVDYVASTQTGPSDP